MITREKELYSYLHSHEVFQFETFTLEIVKDCMHNHVICDMFCLPTHKSSDGKNVTYVLILRSLCEVLKIRLSYVEISEKVSANSNICFIASLFLCFN